MKIVSSSRTVRHVRDRSFEGGIGRKFRNSDYGMPIAPSSTVSHKDKSWGGRHMYIFGKCGDRELAWILLALTALVVFAVNVYAAALP